MGKHDFLSPKAIANRIKSKGLQKLRWFCQMCQKQCRDENGFKCHCTSEAHLRQMSLFAANPEKFMDYFSEMFEEGFLELLQRRFGTRRVQANHVYNEYIQDKQHVHMNSTMWATLGDFVKYLGRTGQCTIEETEKGWFIQWINRDPEMVRRQEEAARRKEREAGATSIIEDEVEQYAEQARAEAAAAGLIDGADDDEDASDGDDGGDDHDGSSGAGASSSSSAKALRREEGGADSLVKINLGAAAGKLHAQHSHPFGGAATGSSGSSSLAAVGADGASAPSSAASAVAGRKRSRWDADDADNGSGTSGGGSFSTSVHGPLSSSSNASSSSSSRPMTTMERMMAEEQAKKAKAAAAVAASAAAISSSSAAASSSSGLRQEDWLHTGIVVKCLNKKVGGGKYYKQKGVIIKIEDTFIAHLKMLDSGDVLRVDQADLETVVPAVGGAVVIVNGKGRGCRAQLLELHIDRYCADLKVTSLPPPSRNSSSGIAVGSVLKDVEYEDFSRAAE